MRPNYASDLEPSRREVLVPSAFNCFLIDDALGAEDCESIIDLAEESGFTATGGDYPASYRNNDRLVRDDALWAQGLFDRLERFLPAQYVDAAGATWQLQGLNPRFRFCRYRGGQSFGPHRDGAWSPSGELRSQLTVMLYLNDAEEFTGGSTRYYAGRTATSGLLGAIRPRRGSAVVFDHALWHDGEAVLGGIKYVMRTDVLYARDPATKVPASPEVVDGSLLPRGVLAGHPGYVWSILRRGDGRLMTASRDGAIRSWSGASVVEASAASSPPPLEVLRGHEASVVALVEDVEGGLWSASRDRTVRRWDGPDAGIVGRHEGAALCLASLGREGVASGGADGIIRRWSLEGREGGGLEGHTGWVWALAVIGGGRLVSGAEDATLRMWDVGTRAAWQPGARLGCVATAGAGAPVRALVALSDDLLASGDAEGGISLWRMGHGRLAGREHSDVGPPAGDRMPRIERIGMRRIHDGAVCALALLPGGRLASGGEDDRVRISALPDLSPLASGAHADFVRGLAVLPEGLLASCSYDATVRFWRVPASGGEHAARVGGAEDRGWSRP